jgi:hypothetical protein
VSYAVKDGEAYSLRDAWQAGGAILREQIPGANLRLTFLGDGLDSDRPLSNYEIWLIRRWLLTTMPRIRLYKGHNVRYRK